MDAICDFKLDGIAEFAVVVAGALAGNDPNDTEAEPLCGFLAAAGGSEEVGV
jgi:hypothetical protein